MNDKEKKSIKAVLPVWIMFAKYLFALIVTVLAFNSIRDYKFFVFQLIELAVIFSLSNLLMKKKKIGNIINSVLMFLYNAQMLVMIFGSSYITMVMLTNIESLKALSGKLGIYLTGVFFVVVFSFLPIHKLELKKIKTSYLFSAVLILEVIVILFVGGIYSPIYGYIDLINQKHQSMQLEKKIADASKNGNAKTDSEFYKEGIVDCVKKEQALVEKPNVILIFTEGLSQSIVNDERGLMPNVQSWQSKSLSFEQYYNHTFATYRGIIGQLYSGHQLNNEDTNSLISIQSIFKDLGYNTAFINTEPHNAEFTRYLTSFGFDELIGDTDTPCSGMANSVSDKDAYELLYNSAIEKAKADKPFFMSIYTFGTHVSLDSINEKFGDGSDAELNKFYDMDYQFGAFMEKFNNSPLAENTIIVFTADHATFVDDSFKKAFPNKERRVTTIDEVPLFIYHKGVEPNSIAVGGRNSLNLAPTILDYLDISVPNYFLGSSLFAEAESSEWEYIFQDGTVVLNSKNGSLDALQGDERKAFDEKVKEYYIIN